MTDRQKANGLLRRPQDLCAGAKTVQFFCSSGYFFEKSVSNCVASSFRLVAEKVSVNELVGFGQCNASTVETVLPLAEARKAQELSKTGHSGGKIALEVNGR
jgi:hypothetical protein